MSPKNQNESLILSYLEADQQVYKQQSEMASSKEQHYYHGWLPIFHRLLYNYDPFFLYYFVPGELKVNTGTNSA